MWILAAIMWLNVALRIADDDGALEVTFFAVAAIVFSFGAFRLPAWERNAPKAEALNGPLLGDAIPSIDPAPPVTRRQQHAGMVMAALLFGIPFGIGTGVGDGNWIVGLGGGFFFGALMVVLLRWIYRRGTRR